MKPAEHVSPSVRELLWDLPELLAGSDPVLEQEPVRERIRRDPEARGALLAVAEYARVLSTGMERLRAPTPRAARPVLRSVETARRYYASELASLLFDLGLDEFNRGTRSMSLVLASHLLTEPKRDGFELLRTVDALAEALGVNRDEFVESELGAVLATRDRDPLDCSQALMTACNTLRPGWEGVWYYLEQIPALRGHAVSADRWRQLSDVTVHAPFRAEALLQQTHALRDRGESKDATDVLGIALMLRPTSAITQFYGALYNAEVGQARDALASLYTTMELIHGNHSETVQIARAFASESKSWHAVRNRQPRLWDQLVSALSPELSHAAEGS